MRTRRSGTLLAFLTVLALSSCGGDDALSKPEFVSQADTICKRAQAELNQLPEPKSAKDLQALAARAASLNDRTVSELKALKAPEDVATDYGRVVDTVARQSRLARDLGKAASKGDSQAIGRLATEGRKTSGEGARLARRIGFKVCGGVGR